MQTCPVSLETIDKTSVRLTAIIVVLLASTAAVSGFWEISAFLAIDFFIRAFLKNSKWSLLSKLGRTLSTFLKLEHNPVDAGPKKFAAKLGFIFSFSAFAFAISGMPIIAMVAAFALAGASFLEGVFGYCFACQVYHLIYQDKVSDIPG